jgi:hypothetical protein
MGMKLADFHFSGLFYNRICHEIAIHKCLATDFISAESIIIKKMLLKSCPYLELPDGLPQYHFN